MKVPVTRYTIEVRATAIKGPTMTAEEHFKQVEEARKEKRRQECERRERVRQAVEATKAKIAVRIENDREALIKQLREMKKGTKQ